jgi:pyruvate kinase
MPQETAPTLRYRRTKIVATVGPTSSDVSTLTELILAGVNVFRLNMSHGTQAEHRERYERIRRAASSAKREVAVLADLCGPKIRVGHFENGQVKLTDGSAVIVTIETVLGTATRFSSQYPALAQDVIPGSLILLDDGNIELTVDRVEDTEIHCHVVHGGVLKDKKGMNLPNVKVSAAALTEKDRTDALFAAALGVDFIALSFVRAAADLNRLRDLLTQNDSNALLVAKIEKPEALTDIEGILDQSDAIMIARGDLGVELDFTQVPNVQEQLVDQARAKHKPVIVATQMLESMITQARPTRAEVTDVANAVRSGADAVMLSAETAAGAHPVEAVKAMDRVIRNTEQYLYEHGAFGSFDAYTPTGCDCQHTTLSNAEAAIAAAVGDMSRRARVSAIVARGHSETLLSLISSQRPSAVILTPATTPRAVALGCLSWGVFPQRLPDATTASPMDLVRSLESQVELEQRGGFWVVASSSEAKNAELALVTT